MEQLENQLSSVFADKAARVPSGSIRRLMEVDYHPRTSWITRRRALVTGAGAGAVGAAVATAVLLAGATPAFAGWVATPKAGHQVPSAAAAESCQTQLASLPTAPPGNWSAVVTDVRGPYTLAVFENQGLYGTCITGPSLKEASVSGASGAAVSIGGSSAVGQQGGGSQVTSSNVSSRVYGSAGIESAAQTHLDSSVGGAYTIMEGEVASDVSGVSVQLADGTDVGTTLGGGWFVAWWPNDQPAVTASVTTDSGTSTVPLDRLQTHRAAATSR